MIRKVNNMKMKNKYILTDIDGVVLDWEEGFNVWMEFNGHKPVEGYRLQYGVDERFGITKEVGNQLVRQFNASAAVGFLPPLRDAQYFIKKLHEQHKYKFIAVTSLSLDPYAQKLRKRNLAKLFGDNAFEDVICLDTGADKDEILIELSDKYQGCYWIEDKPENAEVGGDIGYDTFLMEHGHNMKAKGDFKVVKNWEMIYDEILGSRVR
jgi:FMN phosphatase YigB (HAD superfamily)